MTFDDEAVERAARALYARMGGHPGYGKSGSIGWDTLSATQRRPWLMDARAVVRAYNEGAAA